MADPTVKPSTQAPELVLRDESDEIIDDLKAKLNALQGQLEGLKAGGGEPPTPEEQAHQEMLGHWHAGLTPHLASRLEVPAEELTEKLESLLPRISDPQLRQELEEARDQAFFLYDTFRKINDHHEALTDSLTARPEALSPQQLQHLLEDGGPAGILPVELDAGLGSKLWLAGSAVSTIVRALVQLGQDIGGSNFGVQLSQAQSEEGPALRLSIKGQTPWPGMEDATEVSAFVFRPGVTAETVVDLLYVEKIIEIQGGGLSLHREGHQVTGFEVLLPCPPVP